MLNIEKPVGFEKTHLFDGEATPCNITAQTQEVVQKIIFPRNGGKDLLDHADALLIGDGFYRRIIYCLLVFPFAEFPFKEIKDFIEDNTNERKGDDADEHGGVIGPPPGVDDVKAEPSVCGD